jgi:AcrR family transcriptional regulator
MSQRVRAVAEALLTGSPFHPVRVHEELAEHASGPLRERLRQTFQNVVLTPVVELFEGMERSGELRPEVAPRAAAGMLIGVCMAFLHPQQDGDEGWSPLPLSAPVRLSRQAAAEVVCDLVLGGVAAR